LWAGRVLGAKHSNSEAGGSKRMLHGVLRENTRKERPAARRQGSVTSDEHYRAIWGRTSASRTAHLNARPDVPRRSRRSRRRRPCHADPSADGRVTPIPAPTAVLRRSRRQRRTPITARCRSEGLLIAIPEQPDRAYAQSRRADLAIPTYQRGHTVFTVMDRNGTSPRSSTYRSNTTS
jgi:hypothetical protein